jgi:hypothetical protein
MLLTKYMYHCICRCVDTDVINKIRINLKLLLQSEQLLVITQVFPTPTNANNTTNILWASAKFVAVKNRPSHTKGLRPTALAPEPQIDPQH